MLDRREATAARRLCADTTGTIAVEYGLLAAIVVFAVVTVLKAIGGGAMLGLPPVVNALQTALS